MTTITMKNKLYDFLDKRRAFLTVLLMASPILYGFGFTNKLVMAAIIVVILVSLAFAFFLIWEETTRSHARALQSLKDRRNSASPHWDGQVRSAEDIEPRLKLLNARILQDRGEILRIRAEQYSGNTHE